MYNLNEFGALLGHDLDDLFTDVLDLGRRGVVSLPQAILTLLGERNAKQTKLVAISGGDVKVGVDERLPLLDQGADLVGGEVHSVELSLGSAVINIQDFKFELAVESILILVQVSEVGLNADLERLRSDMGTHRARHDGFADVAMSETAGALSSYHSFSLKGSTAFFPFPFLPLERRLFLPTAMLVQSAKKWTLRHSLIGVVSDSCLKNVPPTDSRVPRACPAANQQRAKAAAGVQVGATAALLPPHMDDA